MNILCVNAAYAPFVGGAEAYLRAMAERLARDGHSLQVVTTDAAEVEAFWHPRKTRIAEPLAHIHGVDVRRVPLAYLPFAPLSFYLLRRVATTIGRWPSSVRVLRPLAPLMPRVPRLARTLRALPQTFDFVHGVNIALEWPLIAAWRFARERALPFIATPFVHVGESHSTAVLRNYTMPHQLEPLRAADAVIAQTEIERQCLIEHGIRPERLYVHGMGVDLAEVQGGDGDAFRAARQIRGPIVLFLGVITKDKGSIHLLEAMRRLWSEEPLWAERATATLVLAGKPVIEFETYWRTLPNDVTRRIIRTGIVAGAAKRDLLAAATVLVLPSRIDSFGAVYLEAWANGVPVIGARAGGVPAVIDDGQDGLLVRFGAVDELAAAIKRLLADDVYRRALGQAGQAKVRARYTWDMIYQQLQSLYTAVAATRDA